MLYCDRSATNQAVYRGRIKGTSNISSGNIIEFLETWTLSTSPTISVGTEVYDVDSACPIRMVSPDAPNCFIVAPLHPTTMLPTAPDTTATTAPSKPPTTKINAVSPLTEQQQKESISSAELGGIIIGVIIIVLLLVFVILLTLLLIRSFCWYGQSIK